MSIGIAEITGATGLVVSVFTWGLGTFRRRATRRAMATLREDVKNLRNEVASLEEGTEANAHSSREYRHDFPAFSQALRMVRSGTAVESVAVELGIPTREVRLLAKVSAEIEL